MTSEAFALHVLVNNHRLGKHRNDHGEYVLGRPDTQYQIILESLWDAPAVVEVFVDGHSVLCPPKRTRLLRGGTMCIRGFEKQGVDMQSPDGVVEESFEYSPFLFSFPSMEDDRNHPELGLIRMEMFEPVPVEVVGRRRRGQRGEDSEPAVQPRQGKKANGIERLTTKEGERQLTAPRALRTGDVHTVYTKGESLGVVELRYYYGIDPSCNLHPGDSGRFGDAPRGSAHKRSARHGGRSSLGFASSQIFAGPGARLGGTQSRDAAFARLTGGFVGSHGVSSLDTAGAHQHTSQNLFDADSGVARTNSNAPTAAAGARRVETNPGVSQVSGEEDSELQLAIELSLADSFALQGSHSLDPASVPTDAAPANALPSPPEQEDDDAWLQAAIALSLIEVAIGSQNTVADSTVEGPSATASSQGDEQCYFCKESRTKKMCKCVHCQDGQYAVCSGCFNGGRAACHKCKGADLEVFTDSQLRSNEELFESSATSSRGRTDMYRSETFSRPSTQMFSIGDAETPWPIEEEYADPSWASTVVIPSETQTGLLPPLAELTPDTGGVPSATEPDSNVNDVTETISGQLNQQAASAQGSPGTSEVGAWARVIVDFNPHEYGPEYLNLQSKEWLFVRPHLEQGWAFAWSQRLSRWGWVSPDYVVERYYQT
eukprot:TRINITY_DN19699_c0_g1_i1.p1 TRINITY_DN19699_c0_g1~~TRINITY_DN19699_c0_g1_i1.p1  ORF type:complete len:658 (+),score=90.27 TRINITY_DN19699_c0_g1_i1:52-2025(+)